MQAGHVEHVVIKFVQCNLHNVKAALPSPGSQITCMQVVYRHELCGCINDVCICPDVVLCWDVLQDIRTAHLTSFDTVNDKS